MNNKKINKTVSTPAAKGDELEKESYVQLPLVKINFIIMAVAGVMIVLGFLLMGGGSSTEEMYNPDIFSTRRIVVGPLIAFLGFVLMGVGIMWKGTRNHGGEQ